MNSKSEHEWSTSMLRVQLSLPSFDQHCTWSAFDYYKSMTLLLSFNIICLIQNLYRICSLWWFAMLWLLHRKGVYYAYSYDMAIIKANSQNSFTDFGAKKEVTGLATGDDWIPLGLLINRAPEELTITGHKWTQCYFFHSFSLLRWNKLPKRSVHFRC